MKIIFLFQKNKLSDVNKNYNDIGNGQKFKLKPSQNKKGLIFIGMLIFGICCKKSIQKTSILTYVRPFLFCEVFTRKLKEKKQAQLNVFSIFVIPVSNVRRVSYISANSIQGRHGRLLAGKISTVATSLLLPLPLFCKIQARPLHCLISHGDPGILPITLSFFENFPVKRFYS